MALRTTTLITLLISSTMGAGIYDVKQTCPSIQCVLYDSYMEPNNLCMQHEAPLISGVIKLRSCGDNPNQVCDLFEDFAWTQGALTNQANIKSS